MKRACSVLCISTTSMVSYYLLMIDSIHIFIYAHVQLLGEGNERNAIEQTK